MVAVIARDTTLPSRGGEFLTKDFLVSCAQTEDLESARIGESWPIPVHKSPQATGPIDEFRTWLQIEVVSVSQHRRRTKFPNHLGDERLHRRFCTDRYKSRGGNVSVGSVDNPRSPQLTQTRYNLKIFIHPIITPG